uniref:Uncharacterized protein n=1 Tax=Schistocephalus solidus TaxID=70667 RepID=A0A0X3NWH5_SCHSO
MNCHIHLNTSSTINLNHTVNTIITLTLSLIRVLTPNSDHALTPTLIVNSISPEFGAKPHTWRAVTFPVSWLGVHTRHPYPGICCPTSKIITHRLDEMGDPAERKPPVSYKTSLLQERPCMRITGEVRSAFSSSGGIPLYKIGHWSKTKQRGYAGNSSVLRLETEGKVACVGLVGRRFKSRTQTYIDRRSR